MKKVLSLAALALIAAASSRAGVVRHVVKPAAKASVKTAKVTAKVIKTSAHVAKTVIY